MVWRNLAKIVVAGAEAVGRAFTRAVQEEIAAHRQAGMRQAAAEPTSSRTQQQRRSVEREAAQTNAKLGMTLQESMQILNVSQPLNADEVRRRYENLFAVNDRTKGGTLYLQAKIFRAKERLDAELERLEREAKANEEAQKSSE